MLKKNYPFIKQNNLNDCGVVSIATIAKFYKLNVSIEKLKEISGTDKNGNNVMSLVYALERLGFDSEGFKLKEESVFEFERLPAIFHMIKNGNELQYVVVYSITNEEIIYADPSDGIINIPPEEFLKNWTNVVITAKPGDDFIKGDMNPNFLLKYFSLIKTQKVLFIKTFLISLLYTIFSVAGLFFYRLLFEFVIEKSDFEMLTYMFSGFMGLSLMMLLLNLYRARLQFNLNKKLDMEMIMEYYKHILHLPIMFFETRKKEEVLLELKEAKFLRNIISSASIMLMTDLLVTIFGIVLLANWNIVLFSVAFSVVFFYIILNKFFYKLIDKRESLKNEKRSKINSVIKDSVLGIETVKINNRQDDFINELHEKLDDFLNSVFQFSNMETTYKSLLRFINIVFILLILWIGTYYVLNKEMMIGELFTFTAIFVYIIKPFSNLINLPREIKKSIVVADRFGELIELKKEKDCENKNANLNGDIIIKNLCFRYGMRKKVLDNINIEIKQGDKVAIVGESGSGKTTFAKLLLSFYSIQEGSITINGFDINEISYKYLRDRIAYIQQDIFLFGKSIKENIIGDKKISDEDFEKIAKLIRCDEVINELPLKFDTILTENKDLLSQGQKQRIALARALMSNPDILILDEATSNLDTKTESAIINAVFNILKDKTSIVIAHRLNTISRCDKIIVLDRGKVIEAGSHDELLNTRGHYFKMWDMLDGD
ncbi:MAG: peptidase domain-containing ABC transporter [Clostridiales bacterium]